MTWTGVFAFTGLERDDDAATNSVATPTTIQCSTAYSVPGNGADRCLKLNFATNNASSHCTASVSAGAAISVNAFAMFTIDIGGGAITADAGIITNGGTPGNKYLRANHTTQQLDVYDAGGTLRASSTSQWSTSAITRFYVMFDTQTTGNVVIAIWNQYGALETVVPTGIARSTFFNTGDRFNFGDQLAVATNYGADMYGACYMQFSQDSNDNPLWKRYPRVKYVGGGMLPPTQNGKSYSGTSSSTTPGPPGTLTVAGNPWVAHTYINQFIVSGGKSMFIADNTTNTVTGTGGWGGGGNPAPGAFDIYMDEWTGTRTTAKPNGWKDVGATLDLGSPGAHPGHDSDTSFQGTGTGNGLRLLFTYSAANPIPASAAQITDVFLSTTQRIVGSSKVSYNGMLWDRTNTSIVGYEAPPTSYVGCQGFATRPAGGLFVPSDFDLDGNGLGKMLYGGRSFTVAETSGLTVSGRMTSQPGPVIVYQDKGEWLETLGGGGY